MPAPVSVALCTYNGERYLGQQLDSIFGQSVLPAEVVVSDDASRDGTLAVARAAHAEHLRREPGSAVALRIIENAAPLGVTANFEQAMRATTQPIILLSDQDDVWAHDRVERTLAAFDRPDVLLVHSDARLVTADGAPLDYSLFESYGVDAPALQSLRDGSGFEYFLRRNLVTGATAAVRRELLDAAVPFPPAWVHDEWLAVVAAERGGIVPLPDKLIDYRQHGSNQIGVPRPGIRTKLARITAPGAERNRRLLARAVSLAERYDGFSTGARPDRAAAVAEKVEHERVRSGLGVHRLSRIGAVVREARTGRYRRFGGGLQDVVRDLLQPLR